METIKHQAAPRRQPPRRRTSCGPLAVGLGLAALFCLLLVALVAYLFLPQPVQASGPSVVILNPASGATAELNVPLPVQASASAAGGVSRLEVYADGALVAAQDSALPGGANPLLLSQTWAPLTPGRHVLMARAYPRAGGHSDSPVVVVDVVEQLWPTKFVKIGEGNTSVNDLANALGVAPDDLYALNPGLPPDPNAPIPPGTDVEIPAGPASPPPGGGAPPPPLPGAPAPPTNVALTLDCASAQLTWTDAPDEEAYVIYRLDMPLLTNIATLPANTTNFTDALPGLGTWSYQVASLKGGVESLSPLVTQSTPDGCAPPAPAEDLILTLETLDTEAPYDGVYCYFNIMGAGWERYPASDFLYMHPGPDGLTYDLGSELPNHGVFHLSAPADGQVTLGGECWGKLGPEVSLLGSFSASHPSADWGGGDLIQTASVGNGPGHALLSPYNVRIIYRIQHDPPLFFPWPWPWFEWLDEILGLLALPAPTNLHIENSLAGCVQYADPVQQFACVFGGLFTGGWPTIFWDWTGNAVWEEGELTRYLVTARAIDLTSNVETTLWAQNIFRAGPGVEIRRSLILPTEGLPCGSRIEIDVQAIAGTNTSATSSIVWQETPACPEMDVTVSFDSFTLDGANDVGEFCFFCDPNRLELSGLLGANWNLLGTGETGGGLFDPCYAETWCLDSGTYNVANLYLISGGGGVPALGNNVLNFTLDSDFGVTVWFALSEMDLGSGTEGCSAFMEFPPTNPVDWPGTINGSYSISDPVGDGTQGTCTLAFTITGVPAP